MTKQNQNTNQGGRPKSYAPDLVRKIVLELIEAGVAPSEIDSSAVKDKLCEHHGVSKQIRPEPLQELVEAILAEIAEEEARALLASLPEGVAASVDAAMAAAGQELQLLVARQNAACKKAADAECEILRTDKRNANWRIAELEALLKERERDLFQLETERDAAMARAEEVTAERDVALEEVAKLRHETGTVDRLVAELRDPANWDGIRSALAEIPHALEAQPPRPET
jgi:chromosome segregation ATPase